MAERRRWGGNRQDQRIRGLQSSQPDRLTDPNRWRRPNQSMAGVARNAVQKGGSAGGLGNGSPYKNFLDVMDVGGPGQALTPEQVKWFKTTYLGREGDVSGRAGGKFLNQMNDRIRNAGGARNFQQSAMQTGYGQVPFQGDPKAGVPNAKGTNAAPTPGHAQNPPHGKPPVDPRGGFTTPTPVNPSGLPADPRAPLGNHPQWGDTRINPQAQQFVGQLPANQQQAARNFQSQGTNVPSQPNAPRPNGAQPNPSDFRGGAAPQTPAGSSWTKPAPGAPPVKSDEQRKKDIEWFRGKGIALTDELIMEIDAVESALATALSGLGYQEAQIGPAVEMVRQQLMTDTEASRDQLNNQAAGAGSFSSGWRNNAQGDISTQAARSQADLATQANQQYTDVYSQRQEAYNQHMLGLMQAYKNATRAQVADPNTSGVRHGKRRRSG